MARKQEVKPEVKPKPKAQPLGPVRDLEWGEDPIDLYRRMRFSLKATEKARIAVLSTKVKKAMVHYGDSYFYCPGDGCPFCTIKKPSPRYLVWVFKYTVNPDGVPIKPLAGVMKAWMFGRDKYGILSGLKAEWGDLRKVELLIECTDERYQRMSIVPARECLWSSNKPFGKSVVKDFNDAVSETDIVALMARTLTNQEIIDMMNQGSSKSAISNKLDQDIKQIDKSSQEDSLNLQDMLDNIDAK